MRVNFFTFNFFGVVSLGSIPMSYVFFFYIFCTYTVDFNNRTDHNNNLISLQNNFDMYFCCLIIFFLLIYIHKPYLHSGVMISMLFSSAVDCGFYSWFVQTEDYICYISALQVASRSMDKDLFMYQTTSHILHHILIQGYNLNCLQNAECLQKRKILLY